MLMINWRLKVNTLMNIVEVWGTWEKICMPIPYAERLLLADAVRIIEKGISYKGKPIQRDPTETSNQPITAYFSLIFPSWEELNEFVKEFQQ